MQDRHAEESKYDDPAEHLHEQEVESTNILENIAAKKTLLSRNLVEEEFCIPRAPTKKLKEKAVEKPPWDFNTSVFASYRSDTPELLELCFEYDWRHSRCEKILKPHKDDIPEIKRYLCKNYEYVREAYKYYSSIAPSG